MVCSQQNPSHAALHLPIALWLVVGIAYVRFSGELFIYYVLIALGGGVLTAFTMMMFAAIGVDAGWIAEDWLVPCGAMGAASPSSCWCSWRRWPGPAARSTSSATC